MKLQPAGPREETLRSEKRRERRFGEGRSLGVGEGKRRRRCVGRGSGG